MGNLSSFKDLDVWKNGHKVVLNIYKTTQSFPSSEQFGLTNQLRRASVSVTSNIAEGFARRNQKEKIQFYYMSLGSLYEIENQIQISYDIKYMDIISYDNLNQLVNTTKKLVISLIRSTRNKSSYK